MFICNTHQFKLFLILGNRFLKLSNLSFECIVFIIFDFFFLIIRQIIQLPLFWISSSYQSSRAPFTQFRKIDRLEWNQHNVNRLGFFERFLNFTQQFDFLVNSLQKFILSLWKKFFSKFYKFFSDQCHRELEKKIKIA